MTHKVKEVIRKVFDDLAEAELTALVEAAALKTYPPNTVLCHEGQVEHTFYIVIDGTASVTQTLSSGGVRQVATVKPGQFFGEMGLIEGKPRAADVTTAVETAVLEISEEHFNSLIRNNPSVALLILRTLTSNLRLSDQASIADLSRKNLELERAYAELKAAQAELVAKELLERELKIAADLQQTLLPQVFPKADGWSFAGRNVPARTVGGDLYDVIKADDEHLGLLMADVSDKSIHAALFMAITRALFLPESRRSVSPNEVVQSVHRGLLEVSSEDNMFVTAFYGVLHPASGRLRYIRAGQDRPLWLKHNSDDVIELDGQGRFLGMLPSLTLEEREVVMSRGDVLVMYSDGIPDTINLNSETYGLERLVELLKVNRKASAQGLCDIIFNDVFEFRGDAAAFDDITVLIAKADD